MIRMIEGFQDWFLSHDSHDYGIIRIGALNLIIKSS